MIERIVVLDDERLDFFLNRGEPLFPGYLTIGILPAAALRADRPLQRRPLGSGPFRLVAWPQPERLELVRVEDQQRFVFEEVKDPTMRVLKLLRGEVDLLQNDLPPELLDYLADRDGIHVRRARGSNFAYLGFNMQDPSTGEARVRRAVALAIDRQAIIRHVFRGAARPAAALLPPEHWAGARDQAQTQRDLAAARRLLQQAGYSTTRPLRLSYKTSSDPLRLRIATLLQHQLAEAGIEVTIHSYDWGTFYADIKSGRFQMYSLAWVGVKSPDIFRYAFHSASLPPEGANRGRLRDAQVDELIERARDAQRPAQRVALYRRLQTLLGRLLPYVPLWFEDQFFAARDEIADYALDAHGDYDALLRTRRAQPLVPAQVALSDAR
jgi:peptide/nickel transport system substrate-binding protein